MSAGYQIETDPLQAMLIVTLEGFFSLEEIESLRHDLRRVIPGLRVPSGYHVSLFDIRKCKIQSQDIVSAFREMGAANGTVARRLAIVVGDSLMRMQLHRIVGPERSASYFDNVYAAKRWLAAAGNENGVVTASSGSNEARLSSLGKQRG
jgi:hypothetical protein